MHQQPGQTMNPNCMVVVGANEYHNLLFLAPMEKTPPQSVPVVWRTDKTTFAHNQFSMVAIIISDVLYQEESDEVQSLFYGDDEPSYKLSEHEFPVENPANTRSFALENWGVSNKIRAFLVCDNLLTSGSVQNFQSTGVEFSTNASINTTNSISDQHLPHSK